MISVEEAVEKITGAFEPLPGETIALTEANGRVLAEDVAARVTQPPFAVSAMDGYAVRAADVADAPVTLTQIGAVPAGQAFEGSVGAGQTVRIFTGSRVPDGADTIVIQENVEAEGTQINILQGAAEGRYIRPAGLDFKAGEVGLPAGLRLSARTIGLAAAMNVPWLSVHRKPRVAILATGDEIVMPGENIGPNQIVSSNALALKAAVETFGGEALNLGIATDDSATLATLAARARGADILVTTGGASVGEHDLVRRVLGDEGLTLDFWKIAMRPGKPLMFGAYRDTKLLGLPGNPVSSLVCALIFLKPALHRMLGDSAAATPPGLVPLGQALGKNDERQDYLRARFSRDASGTLSVAPYNKQDSSMLSLLAGAEGLIIRPPFAPPAKAGEPVPVISLNPAAVAL